MKYQLTLACLLAIVLMMTSCSTTSKTSSSYANINFNSTLWLQTSAEYKANALQTYNAAKHTIGRALQDSSWTAILEQAANFETLPAAIILDVDETVLDNSPFQARLVKEGVEFDPQTWDQWVAMKTAAAVPGAVDFINQVSDKGVEVIFLTNRECMPRPGSEEECPQKLDTIENLMKAGIKTVKPDNVLLKKGQPGWTSEKSSRREFVGQNYRVIMLFGDDLGDFLPNVKKNITAAERASLVNTYADNWGNKWFMLSNPTYGSWLRVLDDPKSGHLKDY